MRLSDYSLSMLREQIVKGREWCKDHGQKFGTDENELGEPYNAEEFERKLNLYESLVDEFRRRGHDEPITLTDAQLVENEKKIRTNLHAPEYGGYNKSYSNWFLLRDEMVKRKLCPFFAPSKSEW